MMKKILSVATVALSASPALAAGGPFFSLHNTNFVVLLAFLVFIGIVLWAKAPAKVGALLDARATKIKADLDEARALRDEAKAVLASFEAKQKEVEAQSARIVATAKEEAQAAAVVAKQELKASIARRIAAAEEQIASAETAAIRRVREQAVSVAIAAAADILAKTSTAEGVSASIDAAIVQVEAKLH
jgi:F-type H+-transporting ATPase subunit b